MKITYFHNGKAREFEPSCYDEYHMRISEWENALSVIADCRYGYPRARTIGEYRDYILNYLKDLEEEENREIFSFWNEKLAEYEKLDQDKTYLIALSDDFVDKPFEAESYDDAYKKYLLKNYCNVLKKIEDDDGKIIFKRMKK